MKGKLSLLIAALITASAVAADTQVTQRIRRGLDSSKIDQAVVIPLSFQRGVALENMGNNSGLFNGSAPWFSQIQKTTRFYYDAEDDNHSIPFENPMASFGTGSNATPLFANQVYRFGVYSGFRVEDSSATEYKTVLRILAYDRASFTPSATNIAPVHVQEITIPRKHFAVDAAEWEAFARDNFLKTIVADGLKTTVRIIEDSSPWGGYSAGTFTIGSTTFWKGTGAYEITHEAQSDAYYYVVECRGFVFGNLNALKPAVFDTTEWVNRGFCRMYALDFQVRPAWRAQFLSRPHFEQEPAPPTYQGKSVTELLAALPPVDVPVGLRPEECLTVDHSPELRSHPLLDRFVADMGNDPIGLANYVLNEIETRDALGMSDYRETVGDAHIAPLVCGGINRNALGVFLEKQGSPIEQCSLLVYLLRKAGVPAAYMFPGRGGIKLLDQQVDRVLGLQSRNALNRLGDLTSTQLMPVEYPWVALFVNGQWVHVFPWLKDVEIVEGYNLYDFMPTEYNDGYKWLRAFVSNDPAIVSLAPEGAPPSVLFPKFLEAQLNASRPEIEPHQLGVRIANRKNYRIRWSDFPRPFELTEDCTTRERLGDLEKIFDTIQIRIASATDSSKFIDTGILRMCDLLNRRLVARFEKTGADLHRLSLTLSPQRPGAAGIGKFADDFFLTRKQLLQLNNLGATDEDLNVTLTHKRHLLFVPLDPTPEAGGVFLSGQELRSFEEIRPMKKGDVTAICFNAGRVTPAMLDVHAQEMQAYQASIPTPPVGPYDSELVQSITAHLLGMSYFQRTTDFREKAERWHKIRSLSTYERGLAMIKARRVSGLLPNQGDIDPVTPALDLLGSEVLATGNGTIHPNSGSASTPAGESFWSILAADQSAQEASTINSFFGQSEAVSTTRLLQRAQVLGSQGGDGIQELFRTNYVAKGTQIFNGVTLQNADPAVWSAVNSFLGSNVTPGYLGRALMTPGAIEAPGSSYRGVAVFLIRPGGNFAALIGSNLNGGIGKNLPPGSLLETNHPNIKLLTDGNGNYKVVYQDPNTGDIILPGVVQDNGLPYYDEGISDGTILLPPQMDSFLAKQAQKYGYTPTGDPNVDRAAILKLIKERGNIPERTVADDILRYMGDPVNIVTGEFYLDQLDLRLAGPMPLEVRRNYGSFATGMSEFGYGWKVNYAPCLTQTLDDTLIYASEPNGTTIVYRRTSPVSDTWTPVTEDNPELTNSREGRSGGLGNRFNARIEKVVQGVDDFYVLTGADGCVRTFKVMAFPYAGTGALTRSRPYLVDWQDNRGNFYIFSYGTDASQADYGKMRRIQSSNGSFLGFIYNPYGLIVEAYTGDGRRLYYDYDEQGDLIKVTRPDNSVVTYEYAHDTAVVGGINCNYSTHLLVREVKPEGRILENTYDAERRVVEQRGSVGTDSEVVRNATYDYHDASRTVHADGTISGYTTILDGYNREGRFDYEKSNITTLTDPLSRTTQRVWYAVNDVSPGAYPRSLKSEIDPRGLLKEYKYDSQGNLVETKVTGNLTGSGLNNEVSISSATYNTLNLPVSLVNAAGVETAYTYDTTFPFLPSLVERKKAGVTISTTKLEYQSIEPVPEEQGSYGLLMRRTEAFGTVDASVTEWEHDWHGFITQETQFTGTADPDVVKNYVHNSRGELEEISDTLGRATRFAYDGWGNRIWKEVRDEAGALVSWQYDYFDGNGEIVWSDGPRYNPEDYFWKEYDGAGRVRQQLRWRSRAKSDGTGVEAIGGEDLYASSSYIHDLNGNLTDIVDARHNLTRMTYDEAGQLKTRKMYEGDVTGTLLAQESYDYEPGGQVSTHTDAVGGITNKYYTSRGSLQRQENPDNSALDWRYYLDGRVKTEVLSNGTSWETVYDDLNRTVTRTFKSSSGTTLATEFQQFDRRGNIVQRTDVEGNTWNFTFDGLGRVKTTTGPASVAGSAQQTLINTYDSAGKILKSKNGLNEETTVTMDALKRPISIVTRNASSAVVRRTTYSYSADHHSVVVTEGSGPNAISKAVWTDTFGNGVLSRDGMGSFQLSTFDASGNKESDTDELGVTTNYAYNGLNRLVSQILPGGAETSFVYNPAGDILERSMPGGLKWVAAYNSARQLQSEELRQGVSVTRQSAFTYSTSGADIGRIQTATDANGIVTTFGYDDFRRLQSLTMAGALPEQNVNLGYSYDRRGLPTVVERSSTGNAAGVPVRVERDYDGYGQVKEERLEIDGVLSRQVTQSWDAAGRRIGMGRGVDIAAQGGGHGSVYAFDYRADGPVARVTNAGDQYDFSYGDNALLNQRNNPWRAFSVAQRDPRGRVLSQSLEVGGNAVLSESFQWRADGKLASYEVDRSGAGTWDETRQFAYNERGQLLNESFSPSSGSVNVADYEFDGGTSGAGLGVRTRARVNGVQNWTAANVNQFGRIEQEALQSGSTNLTANGTAARASRVELRLDGIKLENVTFSPGGTGPWSSSLTLAPGPHRLVATAFHESGWSTNSLSQFTITGAAVATNSSYNSAGGVTSRSLPGGVSQTLKWDGLGALVAVTQRDGLNDGYDWSALYDGLGRRVQTSYTPVTAGVPQTVQRLQIDSWYDPLVEFLEIGVEVNGQRNWKVYGPDLNGRFGSLQGIGGLEAVVRESDGQKVGILNDSFGNAVASASGTTVSWNATKVGSYGPLPNQSVSLLSGTVSLAEATVWRGKRLDPTGFYYLGARYYEPQSGKFLSPDPLGHASSMSLYDYANGDPINFCDPDGRFVKMVAEHGGDDLSAFGNGFQNAGEQLGESAWQLYERATTDPKKLADDIAKSVVDELTYVGEFYGSNSPEQIRQQLGEATKELVREIERDPSKFAEMTGEQLYSRLFELAGGAVADEALTALKGLRKTNGLDADAPGAPTSHEGDLSDIIVDESTQPPIPGVCFVAGTLIGTENGLRAIESLRVGDRVLTTDRDSSTEVNVTKWRMIKLRMPNPEQSSDILEIELLRSEEWISKTQCTPGGTIHLELAEMGLRGEAIVESVNECPPIEPGCGRVILATVSHFNSFVMNIEFANSNESLKPTDRHRLFSITRNCWIPSAMLEAGEELQTAKGTIVVSRISPLSGTHRVYNLEVETNHSYFAGGVQVLCHNANPCAVVNVDVANEKIIFRESELYRGTIDEKKPFDAALSAKQPIMAVQADDGSLHIMNGNHRVMAALETPGQSVPMIVHTPKQWEALYGMKFNPNPIGGNATATPTILPGSR